MSMRMKRAKEKQKKLDSVVFVILHQKPASLYQQYQKRLRHGHVDSSSMQPYSLCESSSCTTNARLSESAQTDDQAETSVKEVLCIDGHDGIAFENILKLCREQKFKELSTYAQMQRGRQNNHTSATRLPRFLRVANQVCERLIEENNERTRKSNRGPESRAMSSQTYGFNLRTEFQDSPSTAKLKTFLEGQTVSQVLSFKSKVSASVFHYSSSVCNQTH